MRFLDSGGLNYGADGVDEDVGGISWQGHAAPGHVVVRTNENRSVVGDFADLYPLTVGVVVVRADRGEGDVDAELLGRPGCRVRPGLALRTGDEHQPAVVAGEVVGGDPGSVGFQPGVRQPVAGPCRRVVDRAHRIGRWWR